MKRNIILIVFVVSLLVLVGCTKSADITYEGINIKVTEYAKVPTEIVIYKNIIYHRSLGAREVPIAETTEKPYRVVKIVVSGNPPSNYPAANALSVFSIYDEDGTQCSGGNPINKEALDDVLVKGEVEVIGLLTCKNPDAKKSQFIFRESNTEGLDAVSDKFWVNLAQQPSESTLNVIKVKAEEWAKAGY